jgi:hypothetical protein
MNHRFVVVVVVVDDDDVIGIIGVRRSIVCLGTILEGAKPRDQLPMKSLDFAIDEVFPAAL